MKKSLMYIGVSTLLITTFTGCFGESVSCSGEVEKNLVKEITVPQTKENMIAELLNEKKSMNGMLYLLAKKAANAYGTKPNLGNFEGLPEIEAKVENEYNNMNFLLSDIRTLSKDKEINKVECTGKITIKTVSYEVDYEVKYNSQLGDDKKNIFVEVSSLE